MPWPTATAVKEAARELDRSYDRVQDKLEEVATRVLTAAGLPELVGHTEAARILGVLKPNLSKVPGIEECRYPHPLPHGQLYIADDVRALAERRQAKAAT
jgi:hypothetical protein